MTKTIIVRGQTVTNRTFADDFKSAKSAAERTGRMLEAAGKQATLNANFDWINRIFGEENSPFLKIDGTLSVEGKTAKTYLNFHVPAIKIEADESGKIVASWTKSKKQRGTFVTDVVEGAKVHSDEGDFYFDYKAWKNRAKKTSQTTGPTAKKAESAAQRAITQMESLLEEWADVKGGTDDFQALRLKADQLAKAARQMSDAARDRIQTRILEAQQGVNHEAAMMSAATKPNASKRADTDREEHAEATA